MSQEISGSAPSQLTMMRGDDDEKGPEPPEIEHPQRADFESLSRMRSEAFAMKGPCCYRVCCPIEYRNGTTKASIKVHESYAKNASEKLKHCGIVRDDDGKVIGACQLQMPGDPADRHMGSFATSFSLPGEAHIEWIATGPTAQGKGVGSRLLKWADEYATASGASYLSLEVMAGNPRALALYERKGFVKKRDPHGDNNDGIDRCCDACLTPPFIFCCMGCRYCHVFYMERPL